MAGCVVPVASAALNGSRFVQANQEYEMPRLQPASTCGWQCVLDTFWHEHHKCISNWHTSYRRRNSSGAKAVQHLRGIDEWNEKSGR